ncbi:DUF3047 domain-containing protein [Roseateles sp.]|uniref:DUF3047 domain-containing protein n=1 Tax=Roseateles sp. TaxID=1971397 RepID=UPI0037C64B48
MRLDRYLPRKLIHTWFLVAVLAGMSGCAIQAPPPSASAVEQLREWAPRDLPGKRPTRYAISTQDGQSCLMAQADRSVSLWRRRLQLGPDVLARVEFDWWIAAAEPLGTVTAPESDDSPARLVLAFDGDAQRLSMRNRMKSELVQTLTGEAPPFATLMYVWDAQAESETVVVSAHSDRVRKIVVGSGAKGSRGWQRFKRDVQADYRRAFGEGPGDLIGAAFMTDADNTRGKNQACYGRLLFLDEQRRSLPGSLDF